ncbi:hypothetical protein ElyMa_002341500 [Elysia marginata]|uniref:Secreted protein n=1 Tax=Elysia marginata TaxID=1093978 RepID=A0AAV4G7L6_9GAST|nr:hypothetical protein ElyMa_002341500 [Elysia marginata]
MPRSKSPIVSQLLLLSSATQEGENLETRHLKGEKVCHRLEAPEEERTRHHQRSPRAPDTIVSSASDATGNLG